MSDSQIFPFRLESISEYKEKRKTEASQHSLKLAQAKLHACSTFFLCSRPKLTTSTSPPLLKKEHNQKELAVVLQTAASIRERSAKKIGMGNLHTDESSTTTASAQHCENRKKELACKSGGRRKFHSCSGTALGLKLLKAHVIPGNLKSSKAHNCYFDLLDQVAGADSPPISEARQRCICLLAFDATLFSFHVSMDIFWKERWKEYERKQLQTKK